MGCFETHLQKWRMEGKCFDNERPFPLRIGSLHIALFIWVVGYGPTGQ